MLHRSTFLVCLAATATALSSLAALAASSHKIGQKNKQFSRSEMTIRTGDTVVFKNDDQVTHNVFSRSDGNAFNVKTQSPGTSTPVRFNREGKVEVRCAIHPQMKLVIHVQK